MKKHVSPLLLLLLPFLLSAQHGNLVMNPGFESVTSPAITSWPTANNPGSPVVKGWYSPTMATPDYFNSDRSMCDGFPIALAHSGEGRAAIICGMNQQLPGVHNYKEYLEGILLQKLEAGRKYQVSFYVALDCSSQIASTGIGAYFTDDITLNFTKEKLDVTPQIISYRHITSSDGWTRITGTFTASGGEQYITIGSFSDTAFFDVSRAGDPPKTFLSSRHISLHAYYYVDDVCVSLAEENACKCAAEQVKAKAVDHFLFLLDISNSMNEKNKLKLMKKQMKHFIDSLGTGCMVGIMTFSDHTSMPLAFSSPLAKDAIGKIIDNLQGKGATNGDLALRKVAKMIDSLNVDGKCHVIMATDGIFELNRFTKDLMDSCLLRNNASFCVLQFGDAKNADLEEISRIVPESSYHMVSKDNLGQVLNSQVPEKTVPEKPVPVTVYYSELSGAVNKEFIRLYLQSNPEDHFNEIPRGRPASE